MTNEGLLVTKDGDAVLDSNLQRIYIPVDQPQLDVSFDSLGNVAINKQNIARLNIVDFANTDYVLKYGENLFELVQEPVSYSMNDLTADGEGESYVHTPSKVRKVAKPYELLNELLRIPYVMRRCRQTNFA